MRKQPVIAHRDAQTRDEEKKEEQNNLKPVEAMTPDENRHRR
jgi:hypothetical protein